MALPVGLLSFSGVVREAGSYKVAVAFLREHQLTQPAPPGTTRQGAAVVMPPSPSRIEMWP